jgi:serine/threonine protein phosphatase PrpC
VGSRDGSPVAAAIAVAAVARSLLAHESTVDDAALGDAFAAAQTAVRDTLMDRSLGYWSGATTLSVAAIVHAGDGARRLGVAWIGDSPVGVVSADGRSWRWVSSPDATACADREGHEHVPDAEVRTVTSRITRAISQEDPVEPRLTWTDLQHGEIVIVASDGLLDTGDRAAAELLAAPSELSAKALVDAAAAHGSDDDTTVALLHPPALAPSRRRWSRRR